jgi:hypothetical protein
MLQVKRPSGRLCLGRWDNSPNGKRGAFPKAAGKRAKKGTNDNKKG